MIKFFPELHPLSPQKLDKVNGKVYGIPSEGTINSSRHPFGSVSHLPLHVLNLSFDLRPQLCRLLLFYIGNTPTPHPHTSPILIVINCAVRSW